MQPTYRILIVEDSAAIRTSLRQFLLGLTQARFEITEAENALAALKKLAAVKYAIDLVITDLTMPEMDGAELVRHLRQHPLMHDVPILFLTAHAEEHKRVEMFRLGATDYVVKPFLEAELEARIMGYLERRRAHEELRNNVEQARLTQVALLPRSFPQMDGASICAKYVPAEQLGGDYFDIYNIPENKTGILVADVTGHGIAAALVSFLVAGLLRHTAPLTPEPDRLLRTVSEMLHGRVPENRYATAFYAVYDPAKRALAYSAAGHPPALLLRRATSETRTLALEGTPLGLAPPDKMRYRCEALQLVPGDRVIFHTDGLLEAGDQAPTIGALKRFLLENSELPAAELLDALFELGLSKTRSQRYPDDVTLLLLDVT